MEKAKTTLWISLLFFGLFFVSTQVAKAEIINDFNSTVTVLPDSSILVEEKIIYNFETSIRHGILRTIPLVNSKNEPMLIDIISILDNNNEAYKYTTNIQDKILTIKIGDSDKMVSGIKEYDISYRVFGSITYYEDFDEIYWNVTGNGWQIPIKKSTAKVVLPNNIFPKDQACYYGPLDSKAKCTITESGIFSSGTKLDKNEGLTVAVSFPKGAVSIYQPKVDSAFVKFIKTFWPIVIPIIVFVYMLRKWLKYGKDPKGTGVIIPQYDVPDNLTPLEVGGIVNEEIKNKNISAEIIYLATKGYLKIRQTTKQEKNVLSSTPETDYEFTLLKEIGLLSNDYDKKILNTIFEEKGDVGGVAKLSELSNSFYKSIREINDKVIDVLLNKKYYTNFPKYKMSWKVITIMFYIGVPLLVYNILNALFVAVSAILLSMFIVLMFNHNMPAKSIKGVLTREYLLGLKEYLEIAEKDRLRFHNAPEKKPEIFEQLLPFAMVFGVEKLWAKEFKDIYINPPEWYSGSGSSFNAVSFAVQMSAFNNMAMSSFSSPSGGYNSGFGSSGGGFSGGGGGGGGGGSW